MSYTQTDFAALLRSNGIRATAQRITIVKELRAASRPMSISELEQRLGSAGLDTTTFYRTLETLVEAGLVRKVNLRHAHTDYELVLEGAHHHHLVCTGCGRVEDFVNELCKSLARRAPKQSSFKHITDHSVELFGLCRACA